MATHDRTQVRGKKKGGKPVAPVTTKPSIEE